MRVGLQLSTGAVVAAAVLAASAPSDAVRRAASCVASWHVVATPTLAHGAMLYGTAAVSSSDVWVVGVQGGHRLIEHWNGTNWAPVAAALGGTGELDAVTALSADDAWAVGDEIEHWDGARWVAVRTPADSGPFVAISAVAPNDIWVAGLHSALHWDGTAWTLAGTLVKSDTLVGAAATAGAVWEASNNESFQRRGDRWKPYVASRARPNPDVMGDTEVMLNGIAVASPTDAWAAGGIDAGFGDSAGRVLHWDGTGWRTSLDTGYGGTFTAVAARSPNRAWVVGWDDSDYGGELAYRWNGRHWEEFNPPVSAGNYLVSLSVIGEHDIWAAGTTRLRDELGIKVGPPRPLVEHYSC